MFLVVIALVVLLPFLVRWAAGVPVLPGVEPYVLGNVLRQAGWSAESVVVLFVLVGVVLLVAASVLVPFILRRTRGLVELSDVIRVLLVLSPAWIASASVFPSHALLLVLLVLMVVLWQRSRVWALAAAAGCVMWLGLVSLLPVSAAGIVEFGALNGYGLFGLVLAVVGGFVLWENKAQSYFVALGTGLLFVVSLFLPVLVVVGSVAVAVIGGLGVVRLWHRKWAFSLLRMPTLVVCGCGVLFSAVVTVVLIGQAGPSGMLAESLASLPQGTVLTEVPGAWVSWWSSARVSPMPAELRASVWQSRNLAEVQDALNAWNVTVIVITPEMRSSLWNNNDDGLRFLLRQSKTFKSVSQGKPVEVWVYDPTFR